MAGPPACSPASQLSTGRPKKQQFSPGSRPPTASPRNPEPARSHTLQSDADRQPPAELDPAATPAHRSGRFLVLDSFELHKAGARVTCIARLRRREQLFRGEASEIDSPNGRARSAARAVLAAATQAADDVTLGLEGIAFTSLFGRPYYVASVEAAQHRRFIILSGIAAAESGRSQEESAALATLRAIERWMAA